MMKMVLALGAAAVAMSAVPADAQYRHHGRACAKWRHGHCVRWNNRGYNMSMNRHDRWRVGYRFGPDYSYTSYNAIPRTYVSRYNLNPRYRYVYQSGGPVYVVDPTTYAITRILNGR
jgi:hypothetical protein